MQIFAALLTPMDQDGRVDLGALESHAETLVGRGVEGLAAMGTMGEFPDLDREEKRQALDVVGAVARRHGLPTIFGVGGVGTVESCRLAEDAVAAGADELMVLPPLYWKLGATQLARHFAEVGRAAGQVPILVYDLPALAGMSITSEMLCQIADSTDTVHGAKLSDNDLGKIHDAVAMKRSRPGFRVMIGHRDLLLAGLCAGADGAIAELANIAPRAHVALRDAVQSGNLGSASELQRAIAELGELSRLAAPPMRALKVATRLATSPIEDAVRTDVADPTTLVARAAEHTRAVFERYADQLGSLRSDDSR